MPWCPGGDLRTQGSSKIASVPSCAHRLMYVYCNVYTQIHVHVLVEQTDKGWGHAPTPWYALVPGGNSESSCKVSSALLFSWARAVSCIASWQQQREQRERKGRKVGRQLQLATGREGELSSALLDCKLAARWATLAVTQATAHRNFVLSYWLYSQAPTGSMAICYWEASRK